MTDYDDHIKFPSALAGDVDTWCCPNCGIQNDADALEEGGS